MRAAVMFIIDADDPLELSATRISELQSLFSEQITAEERGEVKGIATHPGYKFITRLKGNNPFHAGEVDEFAAYVDILLERKAAVIDNLVKERDAEPRDAMSRRAYDGMVNSIESATRRGRQIRDQFIETFHDLAAEVEPHGLAP